MLITLVQTAAGEKLLPFMLYCVGVVALFFVFRRSISRLREHDHQDDQCLRARSKEAHQAIDQIEMRDWLKRHRGAAKFNRRRQPAPLEQCGLLERITLYQARRVAG
jgi:flagellar biosynthesis/type III secretory pathway M-ring protein FliF/YscJ